MAEEIPEGFLVAPGPGFLVGGLIMLVGIAWMVVLMWNAFWVCCHIKGSRSIALFVVAVVMGGVISKAVVLHLL